MYLARRYGPAHSGFRAMFTSWDDTARRRTRGTVILNGTPENYQYWLSEAIRKTEKSGGGLPIDKFTSQCRPHNTGTSWQCARMHRGSAQLVVWNGMSPVKYGLGARPVSSARWHRSLVEGRLYHHRRDTGLLHAVGVLRQQMLKLARVAKHHRRSGERRTLNRAN